MCSPRPLPLSLTQSPTGSDGESSAQAEESDCIHYTAEERNTFPKSSSSSRITQDSGEWHVRVNFYEEGFSSLFPGRDGPCLIVFLRTWGLLMGVRPARGC